MLDLNIECIENTLMDLKYLNKLYEINPLLKVPKPYLAPYVSDLKYKNLQEYGYPSVYKFIFSSIVNVKEKQIIKGSEMLEILEKYNDCVLDTLYDRCCCSYDDYSYDDYSEEEWNTKFIEFLEDDVNMYHLTFNFSFISSFNENICYIIDCIEEVLIRDLNRVEGDCVIGYYVDRITCEVNIWYLLDAPAHYIPSIDEEKLEEYFFKILKEETLS